jgi:hypothetical protein
MPQGYPHDYYIATLAAGAGDAVSWAVYQGPPQHERIVCLCKELDEAIRRALAVAAYMRTTGTASCAKIFDEISGVWKILST